MAKSKSRNNNNNKGYKKPYDTSNKRVKTKSKFTTKDSDDSNKLDKFINHPETFESYASIVNASTAVSGWTQAMGRFPLPLHVSGADVYDEAVPGVMVCGLDPIYTLPHSATDAINVAAANLAARMRSKNTGQYVYDPCDMMIYHIAGSEIISWLSYGRTALGLVGKFDVMNGYLPKTILEAYGWDWDDLMRNRYRFEAIINVCTKKAAAWNFFGNLEFIKKASQVYTPILCEAHDTTKTQFYIYRPNSFYYLDQYVDQSEVPHQALVRQLLGPDSRLTVDSWLNYMNLMLDRLNEWSWTSIISGDIIKFMPEDIYKFELADVNYETPYIYDEHDLEQFMNLQPVSWDSNPEVILEKTDINGNKLGYLIASSGSNSQGYWEDVLVHAQYISGLLDKRFLRTYRSNLSAAEVMDRTVYDVTYDWSKVRDESEPIDVFRFPTQNDVVPIISAGLYAPRYIYLYTMVGEEIGSMSVNRSTYGDIKLAANSDHTQVVGAPHFFGQLQAQVFKYRPASYAIQSHYEDLAFTTVDYATISPCMPIDQYAFYSLEEMKNIAFARNAIYFGL